MLFLPLLVLTACDDASSSDSDGAKPIPKIEFTATATNTTTTRSPNAAYQYITFDIKSDVEVNVKLVLKEQGQPAPTRQEVLDGAGIYRALKTENKSLFLMYDINSKIKEYREALKASGRNMNILHDDDDATTLTASDTGNDTQNVDALLLKQNTTYTLYVLQSDGPDTTEVQALIDLTTREFDSANLPAEGDPSYPDLGPASPDLPESLLDENFDIVFYDSRDAALIIPISAMSLANFLNMLISIIVEDFTDILFQRNIAGLIPSATSSTTMPISLVYPSFSTDGANGYATYNNENYIYQYGLIHDYNIDYDGYFIEKTITFTSATPSTSAGYKLVKDQ